MINSNSLGITGEPTPNLEDLVEDYDEGEDYGEDEYD